LPVSNDFYRQALDLDLRGKREYTDIVLAAMGGIDKRRFSQFKLLLALSDEALELADRHGMDEFRLRPVLHLPTMSRQKWCSTLSSSISLVGKLRKSVKKGWVKTQQFLSQHIYSI